MEPITQVRKEIEEYPSYIFLKKQNLEMSEKIKYLELRLTQFTEIVNYFNKEHKPMRVLLNLAKAEIKRKIQEEKKAMKKEIKRVLIELKTQKKSGMKYVGIRRNWIQKGSGKWKRWEKQKSELNFSENKVKNHDRFELKNLNMTLASIILKCLKE